MRKLSNEEVKKIQLSILKEVHDFCVNNGIVYFLTGGTLIGAVRHNGFIPWDDDIDISMLRNDYEKFVNEFNEHNDNYHVYTAEKYKWYPYPFAKVSAKGTLVVESTDLFSEEFIGINIDVFPIDNCPDNLKLQNRILRRIKFYRNILALKSIKISSRRSWIKNIILFIGKILFAFVSPNYLALKIDHLAKSYKDCKTKKRGIIVWGYGEREIVDANIFDSTVMVNFEGNQFMTPSKYDEWLTNIYGNYMELPPPEKRISHHCYNAYRLN